MTNFQRATCATFAVLTIVFSALRSGSAIQSRSQDDPAFDRAFTQRFNTVSIENPQGRTQVQTWSGNRVRVMAWSQSGASDANALDARIRFQITSPDALIIVVRTQPQDKAIHLSVIVPRQISLYVKGGSEAVDINGATAALSVETDTGAIAIHLPTSANANLALRAVAGTITSKLPLRIFGPLNTHSLDASLGQGGAPVILRSAHGAIDLLPDEGTALARADAQMLKGPNNPTEPRIIKSSKVLSPDFANGVATPGTEPGASALDQTDASPGATLSDTTNAAPRESRNDPPVDVIKIDTRLVNLNVKVTDGAGKLIPDLTKDDFQIFENNIEQEVVQFEPVTSPVNLVLLLDLSGSTRDRMKIMKKAARKFIESLKPNTRIAVAAFTRKFMVISDFTEDRKLLRDRIDNIKNFNSGTAFYDASWSTLDLFKEVKERRKAIVMLTDGVDNSLSSTEYESRHPFDELLARITQEEVTIYPIYFDTEYETIVRRSGEDTHESYVTARKQLQSIADETGGTLFRADRAEDLEGAYQRVASELQTLYSVAYNPKDKNYDGSWRNVSVQVKRAQGTVKTKRGFYAK